MNTFHEVVYMHKCGVSDISKQTNLQEIEGGHIKKCLSFGIQNRPINSLDHVFIMIMINRSVWSEENQIFDWIRNIFINIFPIPGITIWPPSIFT